MNAVGEYLRRLALRHKGDAFCHRAVGKQHKFFHEFVGVLRNLDVRADGSALLINFKAHLGTVKAYRTILKALGEIGFDGVIDFEADKPNMQIPPELDVSMARFQLDIGKYFESEIKKNYLS